jgi:hypothetical protein
MAASTATTVVWTLAGLAVALALVAGWRVIVHDRSISRIRFGFFWERERSADLEHLPRKEPTRLSQRPSGDRHPAPGRPSRREEKRVQWPPPRDDPDREPSHPGARKDEHGADA